MTTKNILTNYYFLTNLESNPIPIADINSFIESDIYKNSKFKDTFYFKEHVIDSHRESWFTQYEIIPITIQGNSINQDLLSLNNWSLISISSKWTPKTIKTAGYNRLWMFNIIDPTNIKTGGKVLNVLDEDDDGDDTYEEERHSKYNSLC